MKQPGDRVIHPDAKKPAPIQAVPIMSLRAGESPRLNGEDKTHIARLAETDVPLPPILVDRRTMRVIDGMHRLMAASLQGRETIDVEFFEGTEADVFLRAVQENIAHGLPLTQADRRAAAERIIATHPRMSDRAIGHVTGLAAKTVAAIRKRSTDDPAQSNTRVGRDGRVRRLDSSEARRRAAELLTSQPGSSLRDVARTVGISPATVLDVRKRLERGESPVPGRLAVRGSSGSGQMANGSTHVEVGVPARGPQAPDVTAETRPTSPADPAATVAKLLRDPSLRNSDRGKGMLRLLHVNAVSEAELPDTVGAVPPHCVGVVVQLARHYARMWHEFAKELDGRARIIDPSTTGRLVSSISGRRWAAG